MTDVLDLVKVPHNFTSSNVRNLKKIILCNVIDFEKIQENPTVLIE